MFPPMRIFFLFWLVLKTLKLFLLGISISLNKTRPQEQTVERKVFVARSYSLADILSVIDEIKTHFFLLKNHLWKNFQLKTWELNKWSEFKCNFGHSNKSLRVNMWFNVNIYTTTKILFSSLNMFLSWECSRRIAWEEVLGFWWKHKANEVSLCMTTMS